jgi:hypothetical protein
MCSGLGEGLITRPEESYRVCMCVQLCVICNPQVTRPRSEFGFRVMETKKDLSIGVCLKRATGLTDWHGLRIPLLNFEFLL